jgi:hypothetical protein
MRKICLRTWTYLDGFRGWLYHGSSLGERDMYHSCGRTHFVRKPPFTYSVAHESPKYRFFDVFLFLDVATTHEEVLNFSKRDVLISFVVR